MPDLDEAAAVLGLVRRLGAQPDQILPSAIRLPEPGFDLAGGLLPQPGNPVVLGVGQGGIARGS
jgi:hypothetical protein